MAYIKGMFTQEIYRNEQNGYMVGLIRVKESDDLGIVNKVITFTGIFNELKYKATYKMNGNFVNHQKYGLQFQTESYELVLPTDEEEIILFLSSSLFPIGEKTAEKIVERLGKDAINIMISDPYALDGIPRLSASKIQEIKNLFYSISAWYNTKKYCSLEDEGLRCMNFEKVNRGNKNLDYDWEEKRTGHQFGRGST